MILEKSGIESTAPEINSLQMVSVEIQGCNKTDNGLKVFLANDGTKG